MEGFASIIRRYRDRTGKEDSGFVRLFVSKRLIHGAATSLLSLFVPIFLYEMSGRQFWVVGSYFALLSLAYALLLVPAMRITNRLGFSRTLVLAGIVSIGSYVTMFFMSEENFWWLLGPLSAFVIAYRLFHWVPFRVDFTLFTRDGERGRQVSLSFATIAFMGVIGPILAGFIVTHAGYEALFGTAIVLLIAATISYALVPEVDACFEWSWAETWQQLTSERLRGVMVAQAASGAEMAVHMIVWPVFLFELLDGNVLQVGALSTIVVALTIVIQLALGSYLDGNSHAKQRSLQVGSALSALGWILKIFVLSAAQVFLVSLYHNVVRIFTKTPISAILYDMSAEQGRYVDEFTVLREMSGHLGRAASLVLISALAIMVPIEWTFLIAAGAAVSLNMIYHLHADERT